MRRFKKFLIVFSILLVAFSFFNVEASAKPLDEIEDYIINVSMRPDGTMNISYHIEWKVLDSDSEGPLEWVKIGIPNKHVDEISSKSNCISKIGYMYDNGTYVRIDLDRKYEAGEKVNLNFSIHQSYMYVIDDEEHICRYSFTPGWFDEIDVKHIKIMWKNDNVIESSAMREDDGYLIWETSLKAGDRLNASVEYNLDVFTTNENQQFEDGHADSTSLEWVVFAILFAIAIAIVLCILFDDEFDDNYDDDYNSGARFGGGSYYPSGHVSRSIARSSVHSTRRSCACVSHCACACACAGGGRAGCSVKDFYVMKEGDSNSAEDEIELLLTVLDEEANK